MSIPSSFETPLIESPTEMDSDPPPPPPPAEQSVPEDPEYKTKVIQFLGRRTRIVLQNANGPCPLIAICNVLLLKNRLNLPDRPTVFQHTLFSLVGELLIDSNRNIDGNLEQNINDAYNKFPRLATGIDVNVMFRRIDEFEYTAELAIFDLLDIPLYHGWIVDPQDRETADAFGSKSYNTLMGELAVLESGTDTIDLAAATTAALGVPSPSLSRGQSFNESPHRERKGDIEEDAEVLRILKLSKEDRTTKPAECIIADVNSQESVCVGSPVLANQSETVDLDAIENKTSVYECTDALGDKLVDNKPPEVVLQEDVCLLSKEHQERNCDQPTVGESTEVASVTQKTDTGAHFEDKNVQTPWLVEGSVSSSDGILSMSQSDKRDQNVSNSTSGIDEPRDLQNNIEPSDTSTTLAASAASGSSSHKIDEWEAFTANFDSSEPIYEGEERILDSGTSADYGNREPVYEGEVILAAQMDQCCSVKDSAGSKGGLSRGQGDLVRDFLDTNASMLTVYGLFCLREKVKERELCVFFWNNHFNTMFKYDGELYILATDVGYLNQPDVVWEKLNEVNGNSIYITGGFKEFNVNGNSDSTWDEEGVLASTADYLANFKTEAEESSSFNSDLQLALALQQQEFEQRQQPQQPNLPNPTAPSGSSGMVIGPQVPRPSAKYSQSSSKQESKSKEKCTIM